MRHSTPISWPTRALLRANNWQAFYTACGATFAFWEMSRWYLNWWFSGLFEICTQLHLLLGGRKKKKPQRHIPKVESFFACLKMAKIVGEQTTLALQGTRKVVSWDDQGQQQKSGLFVPRYGSGFTCDKNICLPFSRKPNFLVCCSNCRSLGGVNFVT